MLTVKMRNVVESAEVISKLVGERGKNLTPKVARYIGVLVVNAVGAAMNEFETERTKLIKEYGEQKEDGDYEVIKEKVPGFVRELDLILDQPRDLPHLYQLSEDDLASLHLTPAEWRILDWLVTSVVEVEQ